MPDCCAAANSSQWSHDGRAILSAIRFPRPTLLFRDGKKVAVAVGITSAFGTGGGGRENSSNTLPFPLEAERPQEGLLQISALTCWPELSPGHPQLL